VDRPEAQINADSRFTPNLGWRSIAAASYGTIEAYAADFDRSVRIDILQVGLMSLAAPVCLIDLFILIAALLTRYFAVLGRGTSVTPTI
jgi:hypothetical protein